MSTSTQGTMCDGGSEDAAFSFSGFHELESDIEPAEALTGDDPTMNFASGSVVFSISGVNFKVCMTCVYTYKDALVLTHLEIPKALIQQHSEVLSAMLDTKSDSEEQAIALSDSLNAFRQFRAFFFTSVRFSYYSSPCGLKCGPMMNGDPGLMSHVYSVVERAHLAFMTSSISLPYLTNIMPEQ
jgi:hypothetical protein